MYIFKKISADGEFVFHILLFRWPSSPYSILLLSADVINLIGNKKWLTNWNWFFAIHNCSGVSSILKFRALVSVSVAVHIFWGMQN